MEPPSLFKVNHLSANPTKWSNRLKQFIGNSGQIVWVFFTILWGWRLKVYILCILCKSPLWWPLFNIYLLFWYIFVGRMSFSDEKFYLMAISANRNNNLFKVIFIVDFEHISHLVIVFLFLTLNMSLLAGYFGIKHLP